MHLQCISKTKKSCVAPRKWFVICFFYFVMCTKMLKVHQSFITTFKLMHPISVTWTRFVFNYVFSARNEISINFRANFNSLNQPTISFLPVIGPCLTVPKCEHPLKETNNQAVMWGMKWGAMGCSTPPFQGPPYSPEDSLDMASETVFRRVIKVANTGLTSVWDPFSWQPWWAGRTWFSGMAGIRITLPWTLKSDWISVIARKWWAPSVSKSQSHKDSKYSDLPPPLFLSRNQITTSGGGERIKTID